MVNIRTEVYNKNLSSTPLPVYDQAALEVTAGKLSPSIRIKYDRNRALTCYTAISTARTPYDDPGGDALTIQ